MRRFALTPGRVILLLILFVIAATVGLLVNLPAAWAWSKIEAQLATPLPMAKVEAVGGTVWDGVGLITLEIPGDAARQLRLSWDVGLVSLLTEGLGLGWRLETRQSQLNGRLAIQSAGSADLRLEGQIQLAEFADIARRNGLTLPGSITVNNLELGIVDEQLNYARGIARWDGGPVAWNMGGQSGQAHYPPLVARLDEQEGGVSLNVVTEAENKPLMDVQLSADGMATLTVRRRLAQTSGLDAGPGSPDETVFRIQQPLSGG